jgi:hypothetical protein
MPNTPTAPTTILDGDDVVVSWSTPSNGGSPITGYRVYLEKADGTFYIDFTNCDGSDADIFAARSCTIPSNSFVADLYDLDWGEEVFAKLVAYNIYGNSALSALSNPTVLMANPDAPITLQNILSLRSFT